MTQTTQYQEYKKTETNSGYLIELADWSIELAKKYAEEDNQVLTAEHLKVLAYLRKYYDKNGQGYNARTLLNVMEFEFGKWNGRKYLYMLFPHGPVSQGCKYAGLPLPPNCNDLSFGSVH